jgi:hypothetical protein
LSTFGKYLCQHCASTRNNNTLSLMMLKHRSPRVTPCADTQSAPSRRKRAFYATSREYPAVSIQPLPSLPRISTRFNTDASFNPQSILTPHSSLLEKITQNSKSLMRQSQGVMPPLAASATTGVKMVVHPSSERLATFTMSQTECIAAPVACQPKNPSPEFHHDPN